MSSGVLLELHNGVAINQLHKAGTEDSGIQNLQSNSKNSQVIGKATKNFKITE